MDLQPLLLGERRARIRIAAVAVAIPLVASAAFLLGDDRVLGFSMLYLAVAIAFYAGLIRAGVLAGTGVVFVTICWRFVVPPLVGYVRGSMATRYTPPRALGYKLSPRGELVEGLTNGPLYAIVIAAVAGGGAYLGGIVVRRVVASRVGGD